MPRAERDSATPPPPDPLRLPRGFLAVVALFLGFYASNAVGDTMRRPDEMTALEANPLFAHGAVIGLSAAGLALILLFASGGYRFFGARGRGIWWGMLGLCLAASLAVVLSTR